MKRERPLAPIPFYVENSFSFPSWHAVGGVAFYMSLAYIVYKLTHKKSLKMLVVVFAITTVMLLGFSRLYLGVHFPSDVIAGFLIGAIWVIIGILINKVDE